MASRSASSPTPRSSCSRGALPRPARRCWRWPPYSSSNMRSSEAKPRPKPQTKSPPTSRGLRIVGGVHRGRRLIAPAGEAVRPTSDRAREALFNILSHGRFAADGIPFAGAAVLDAFAGTGALGLEALSRGAAEIVFFERDREALAILRRNVAMLGKGDRARVVPGAR